MKDWGLKVLLICFLLLFTSVGNNSSPVAAKVHISSPIEFDQYDSQIIRFATPYDFSEYSYFTADSYITEQWQSLIFSGLYRRGDDGSWEPDLADGQPTIMDNGKTVFVDLKPDLQFPYGGELTTEDVVFSYQMLLTPGINLHTYSKLSEMFASNASISSVDSDTIRFDFVESSFSNLQSLSAPIFQTSFFQQYYEDCIDQNICAFNDHTGYFARGTGPFVLEKISFGEDSEHKVSLVKNPYHWDADNVWASKVEFVKFPTREEAFDALESGHVDIIDSQYVPGLDDFSNIPQVDSQVTDTLSHQEFALNHLHPYFGTGESIPDDNDNIQTDAEQARLVRKAMNHIVDRSEYIAEMLEGLGRPASTAMPAASIGWDDNIPFDEYNVTRARVLMEQAGFDFSDLGNETEDGTFSETFFDITMLSPNSGGHFIPWSAGFVRELPKIGIGVTEHISTGWDVIIPRTFGHEGALPPVYDEGGYDILTVGYSWDLDWDPSGVYTTEGLCDSGDCDNFYNFVNSAIEEAIDTYHTTFDFHQRIEKAKDLQVMLAHELPVLPILHRQNHWGFRSNIEGTNFWLASDTSMNWGTIKKQEWSNPAVIDTLPDPISEGDRFTITHPEDKEFERGDPDAKIEWVVKGGVPGRFYIFENDDSIISDKNWQNDVPIVLDLSTYDLGVYNFRIKVYSPHIGQLEDEVKVTIVEDTGLLITPYPSVALIGIVFIPVLKICRRRSDY